MVSSFHGEAPDSSSDKSAKMLFREAEAYGVKPFIMMERVVNRRTGRIYRGLWVSSGRVTFTQDKTIERVCQSSQG